MLAAGERDTVAYHEAGHVLCAELCPTVDKTLHATINPRGQAAGFAVIGRSDRALHTAQHIHEQLIYILGGRAAEHVVNGTVSSGAANDLEKANAIARAAVEQYGLSAAVGQVVASRPARPSRPRRRSTARSAGSSRTPTATRSHGRGAPRAARAAHPGAADRGRHRSPRDRRRDGGLHDRRAPPEPAAAARPRARRSSPSTRRPPRTAAASGCPAVRVPAAAIAAFRAAQLGAGKRSRTTS